MFCTFLPYWFLKFLTLLLMMLTMGELQLTWLTRGNSVSASCPRTLELMTYDLRGAGNQTTALSIGRWLLYLLCPTFRNSRLQKPALWHLCCKQTFKEENWTNKHLLINSETCGSSENQRKRTNITFKYRSKVTKGKLLAAFCTFFRFISSPLSFLSLCSLIGQHDRGDKHLWLLWRHWRRCSSFSGETQFHTNHIQQKPVSPPEVSNKPSDWSPLPLQAFPDHVEHFPKLSRCLPSIVVEPTDGGDVESGELRWPPDDVRRDVTEGHTQVTGEVMTLK